MISTLRTAARARIAHLSRRDVLIGAGAAFLGDAFVLDPARELLRDALMADAEPADEPVPHLRMDLGLREFDRLADDGQRAALSAMAIGATIPDFAAGRCTRVAEIDGDMWSVEQGEGAGAILWGKPMLGRMADRPDRTFGRWRAECIRAARLRSEPTFELVRAVVNGRAHRYTALIMPGRETLVISADEPASPAPARRSTAPMTHPGIS